MTTFCVLEMAFTWALLPLASTSIVASLVSVARYTSPMPPAPSGETISQWPRRVPAARGIGGGRVYPRVALRSEQRPEGRRDTMTAMLPVDAGDDRLRRWIGRHRRVFALTGAGCSTASGIPDYRDEAGEWKRRPPVMFQAFRTQPDVYRRYWARGYAGWPGFTKAAPSAAHHALTTWESAGTLLQLVTQNVDGLHQRAGSRTVIDLHGRLDVVLCLGCHERTTRSGLQARMAAENPHWTAHAASAPDGDADIAEAVIASFVAPRCDRCAGLLKPDVVFFGENVPPDRYAQAREALARADALLVAGSSLMVYSGFRFVRLAHEAGLPIAIVNRGRTRGDDLAELKVAGDVGAELTGALGAIA